MRERTAHINRIKGLLFGQGIRGINVKARYKTLEPAKLITGEGHHLPERLSRLSRSSANAIWHRPLARLRNASVTSSCASMASVRPLLPSSLERSIIDGLPTEGRLQVISA